MENRIKVIRAELNLTQQALAEKAGINRVTLNRIEKGAVTPSGDTIGLIAKALERPANEIFFDLDVVRKQQEA